MESINHAERVVDYLTKQEYLTEAALLRAAIEEGWRVHWRLAASRDEADKEEEKANKERRWTRRLIGCALVIVALLAAHRDFDALVGFLFLVTAATIVRLLIGNDIIVAKALRFVGGLILAAIALVLVVGIYALGPILFAAWVIILLGLCGVVALADPISKALDPATRPKAPREWFKWGLPMTGGVVAVVVAFLLGRAFIALQLGSRPMPWPFH